MDLESGRESHAVYEFGDFTLDVGERLLMRGRHRVCLPPKSFELLVALVARANRLVTKRELLDQVWPEVFVEEGILTVYVAQLRKALDDKGRDSRYIETVWGSGYRFIAAVTMRRSIGAEGGRHPPTWLRDHEEAQL